MFLFFYHVIKQAMEEESYDGERTNLRSLVVLEGSGMQSGRKGSGSTKSEGKAFRFFTGGPECAFGAGVFGSGVLACGLSVLVHSLRLVVELPEENCNRSKQQQQRHLASYII